MIQINPYLIQIFVTIEALLVIVWGVVKGGINMRRFVFAGSAVIFAFTLPWVLSHLVPGFGDVATPTSCCRGMPRTPKAPGALFTSSHRRSCSLTPPQW